MRECNTSIRKVSDTNSACFAPRSSIKSGAKRVDNGLGGDDEDSFSPVPSQKVRRIEKRRAEKSHQ